MQIGPCSITADFQFFMSFTLYGVRMCFRVMLNLPGCKLTHVQLQIAKSRQIDYYEICNSITFGRVFHIIYKYSLCDHIFKNNAMAKSCQTDNHKICSSITIGHLMDKKNISPNLGECSTSFTNTHYVTIFFRQIKWQKLSVRSSSYKSSILCNIYDSYEVSMTL